MKLDDRDIRRALLERISSYKDCFVYEEVMVPSGKARADLVAINGHVTAYEIKSDYDSFGRLSSQIEEYDLNFERNYIVVGEKYKYKVQDTVPKHWGIILVEENTSGKITLSFNRQAKLNPNLSFKSFLGLLTANQLKTLAKENSNLSKKYSRTDIQKMFKQDIIECLETLCSKTNKMELKKTVREILKFKKIEPLKS